MCADFILLIDSIPTTGFTNIDMMNNAGVGGIFCKSV